MTKAVLANDTSGTSNPGCQGTVACLMDLLSSNGISVISRLPVGYCYQEFAKTNVESPKPSLRTRATRRIQRSSPILESMFSSRHQHASGESAKKELCPRKWSGVIDRLLPRLEPVWQDANELIVNGEGTIHHDSIGARSLIGLCVAGKRLGKRVTILNCSIYALGDALLTALRNSVDQIVVREPVSHRYLTGRGVEATLAADCLFLASQRRQSDAAIPNGLKSLIDSGKRIAVYTPGVLSGSGQVPSSLIREDVKQLVNAGYSVLYYVVEAEDEHLAAAAKQAGAVIIPLGALSWDEVFPFLRSASLVVSGRYHINIFSAVCGVPFIPMQTNTEKMEGLLKLFKIQDASVMTVAGSSERRLQLSSGIRIDRDTIEELMQTLKHSAADAFCSMNLMPKS